MFVFVDDQGKEAENELNKIGPGEATFISTRRKPLTCRKSLTNFIT
jgi:hypothetical protein